MIQLFFFLIQFILTAIFGIATLIYLILAITKRKIKKAKTISLIKSAVSLVLSLLIWNIDLTSTESKDRGQTTSAFESNFGFTPPASIGEVKVKNFFLYDTDVHWMSFTYDSIVFNKIIKEDTLLKITERNTPEFYKASIELTKNQNAPEWFDVLEYNIDKIYYKKDFMKRSFSEFYLCVDEKNNMVYLLVSSFD